MEASATLRTIREQSVKLRELSNSSVILLLTFVR